MDALKNFAYSLVATAPSPATSGTSLVVTAGQGSYFPATPFDATIWPSGAQPTNTNAEIVRVTNVSTDTFTITRAQYGTTAQSITAGYQIAQTVDANLLNQLAPLTGATFTGNVTAPAHIASGLTGATAATRYVGGTTNGAPTSGTFAVGDFIVDQTATIWVCTTAGTPGTWWSTISSHAVLRSATATAGKNEVTIFSGSTASQTISAVGSPVDGATWTFINQGTVNVTAGFASNSMYPLGSGSSVTSYVIAPNSSYTFINYNGGNWYMTSTNDLDNGTGIVKVTNGGTGTSTAPAVGSIPVASSTSAYTPLAIGTSGQVLQSNGTTATWSSSTALATVNLTAQSAAQAATTLYTPASDGLFTITYYAKVTTAATTSSTLGVFSVISTDVDSNVVTTVGQSSQQNSLTAGFISGSITVYAKASTAIQYSLGYASSGATAMQYELHVVVAGTIAPSSTGTVSSFNGRTGAVVPASGDYGASTGVMPTTSYLGGKNWVYNGGMDIWQRGTTYSTAGSGYFTADRWNINLAGTTTFSQSTDVPTAIATSYSLQWVTGASSSYGQYYQALENANVIPLRGQTMTLSAYVKTAGSYAGNILFGVTYSTTTDASASVTTPLASSTYAGSSYTSWGLVTCTFTVPSNAYGLKVNVLPDTAQASGVTFKMTGVQLEIGSTATAFSRAGGTIQGELAACQRYLPAVTLSSGNSTVVGMANLTTRSYYWLNFGTTSRVAPTGITISALSGFNVFNGSVSNGTPTAVTYDSGSLYGALIYVDTTAGSPTIATGQATLFRVTSTGSILFTGCEL